MQREALEALDRIDPLAPLRDKFLLPPGVIYLVGNSLGALPRSTAARVSRVIEKEWGQDLITSWNRHDWIAMPQRVGDKIARLIGAEAGEVVVAESTSINLFKVLAAALKMRPGRRVIASDTENFPTDLYMAEGLAKLLDQDYTLRLVAADDLKQALGADIAVLMLTQVNFRTGAIHDMAALTAAAFAAGYRPAEGIRQYLCSTPSILALAALEESIDLLLQADLAQLRAKSQALTEAFITLVEARCAGLGLSLATPRDPARRGSQVSFAHEQGYAVMQALIARGVVGDFRAPDLIRFGFSPLYIRHVDVWDAAETLRDVLVTGAWRRPEFQHRAAVT